FQIQAEGRSRIAQVEYMNSESALEAFNSSPDRRIFGGAILQIYFESSISQSNPFSFSQSVYSMSKDISIHSQHLYDITAIDQTPQVQYISNSSNPQLIPSPPPRFTPFNPQPSLLKPLQPSLLTPPQLEIQSQIPICPEDKKNEEKICNEEIQISTISSTSQPAIFSSTLVSAENVNMNEKEKENENENHIHDQDNQISPASSSNSIQDRNSQQLQVAYGIDVMNSEERNVIFNTSWKKLNFKVINKLGSGSFGEVWSVEHIEKQKQMAWKEMKYQSQKEKQDVINEVRIARDSYNIFLKQHSSFLQVVIPYGFFVEELEAKAYLVMEYCEGGDLQKYIQDMKKSGSMIGVEDAWNFIEQLLSPIQQFHENRIIHGDLKPSNILLSKDNKVKLAKFGIARELKDEKAYFTTHGAGTRLLAV
ncbi:MAG: putative Serine/Threonine kinase domain protein, partial [Streblomastix strix]